MDDPVTLLLLLSEIASAACLVTGATLVLTRRSTTLLFWAALGAIAALAVVLVLAAGTLYRDAVLGLVTFTLFALPLPIVIVVLTRLQRVSDWATAVPRTAG